MIGLVLQLWLAAESAGAPAEAPPGPIATPTDLGKADPAGTSLAASLADVLGDARDNVIAGLGALWSCVLGQCSGSTATNRGSDWEPFVHPYLGAVSQGTPPNLSWHAPSGGTPPRRVWLRADDPGEAERDLSGMARWDGERGIFEVRLAGAISPELAPGVWTAYVEPGVGTIVSASFEVSARPSEAAGLCASAPDDGRRLCEALVLLQERRMWDFDVVLRRATGPAAEVRRNVRLALGHDPEEGP